MMTDFIQVSEQIRSVEFKEEILKISSEINKRNNNKKNYNDFKDLKYETSIHETLGYIVHYGHRSIKKRMLPEGETTYMEIAIQYLFDKNNEPIFNFEHTALENELMDKIADYHGVTHKVAQE